MEEASVRPLLPILKHDPWVILQPAGLRRGSAGGSGVRHTDSVGSVNTRRGEGVCDRVFLWA